MEKSIFFSIEEFVTRLCHFFSFVAGVILVFLVLVLVGDTIGRFIGVPLTGTFELVEYGFAMIVCFAVPYTAVKGGHIMIDLLFGRFPRWVQALFNIITQILSIGVSALIVWRLYLIAVESYRLMERSSTLEIPVFLFMLAVAFGFAILVLVQVLKLLKSIGVN